jgi:hypothetical protein
MASAVAVVDYREFTKRAVVAGFVTLVLASLLVGIEAVSTVSGLCASSVPCARTVTWSSENLPKSMPAR